MVVNGDISITNALLQNNRNIFGFETESYLYGLNLIRGLIGGGYQGNAGWTQVTKIQFATDSWGTQSATLNHTTKYGGWASALTNGYVFENDQSSFLYNDRVNFPTESITAIANRNYNGNNSPVSIQHGIGFDMTYNTQNAGGTYNTLASYGTRAYQTGNGTSNMDILIFSTESWTANSTGLSGRYGASWFERYYGYATSAYEAGAAYTFRMDWTSESLASISTNSNMLALGQVNACNSEHAVPSKWGKAYVGTNNCFSSHTNGADGYTVYLFTSSTLTWSVSAGRQTITNGENSGVMGMNFGYWAGGYNGNQNAHTDKQNYNTDTIVNISDAPRALSSGSPMWSSY
jgi:hypothetical protein